MAVLAGLDLNLQQKGANAPQGTYYVSWSRE